MSCPLPGSRVASAERAGHFTRRYVLQTSAGRVAAARRSGSGTVAAESRGKAAARSERASLSRKARRRASYPHLVPCSRGTSAPLVRACATRVKAPWRRASRAVALRPHPHDQRLEAARHSIRAQDCPCTARQRALAFACAHACRGSRGATATLVDSSPPKVHCLIVAPARITAVSTSARSGPQGFALRIARAVFGLAFFCSASAIQLRRRRETNDEEIQP
jgi:hypothetical protein